MKKKKLKKFINKCIDKRINDMYSTVMVEYALRKGIEQFKSAKIPNITIGGLFNKDNEKS